ncbi:MAG TPA: tRNA pseudouridine(55) synthase TruB [Longimicrobiaceae bacterium]
MSDLNGVLPVDKPEGPTSHDVVAAARRALGLRRIGHTGTLDPFATGLLLLCLGPSTRLAEYLTALPKSYSATLRLGVATDTDDCTGEVVSTSDAWRTLTREQVEAALRLQVGEILQRPPSYSAKTVEAALRRQVGEILQRPPAYSAKKVEGERMYAAARRGVAVEREPVAVTIRAIRVLRYDPPEVDLEVDCESGTYIRAIARDAGEALGVGGHLTRLRRTRVGDHAVTDALPLERLPDAAAVADALLTPAEALRHLPAVVVPAEGVGMLLNGRGIPAPEEAPQGRPLALLSSGGELLAVGERVGSEIRPRKVFA